MCNRLVISAPSMGRPASQKTTLVSKKSKSMANILSSYCTSNFCDCRQTGAMSIFLVSVIWLQSWLSAFDNVYPVVGQALASVVDGQWEWNIQLILRFFIVPPLWDTHSLVAFL
ncbi:hypothetical protein T4D_5751 [Trichinella pseudospiralis]|uniref:Uncharacterized protein n=1 Tax=Trichinella pseudospiralis TaxID=6337 RepID=A0A0V1F3Y4_TRIPS|nr:hypothetical protein T4D_5751 [Trichinella pseudospiralis]